MTGINLDQRNLNGWNFAGQNLTGSSFAEANLANVDFSQANLTGAYLGKAKLTTAKFTGALLQGANLAEAGLTADQLYSTASYQTGDLSGILLNGYSFIGSNFSGKNLTGANFYVANLSRANFSHANLTNTNLYNADFTDADLSETNLTNATLEAAIATNANFNHANLTNIYYSNAILTGANLTGADSRGALGDLSVAGSAIVTNLILPDGEITGLDLGAGQQLTIRDYDGNPLPTYGGPVVPPLPIHIDKHFVMNAGGALQMIFDADAWDSTVSFDTGIVVIRGGTLALLFAPEISLTSQVGRTFKLFDWTGVSPTGAFTVSSPYTWNVSNLYTTGEVTLLAIPGLPGDFNHDGIVNGADFVVWRISDGTTFSYDVWRSHFGESAVSGGRTANFAVPEPVTMGLLFMAAIGWHLSRRRQPRSGNHLGILESAACRR